MRAIPFDSGDVVYSRPNIVVEPLIHHYYAWLNLVAPVPAAMNFSKLHVPLLRSFVDTPALHRKSARDPRLRGGMFVDLDAADADRVKQLIASLNEGRMPELAAAADELNDTLEKGADGFDLTPRYNDVPPALRGYVELVYDLNDHARVRFIEKLLYRSEFFDPTAQSVDLALATADDFRPFAMTTPRLPRGGHLQLAMPLSDPRIDLICSTMSTPRRFGELRDAFDICDADLPAFASLFASASGLNPDRHTDDTLLRVRYFGHACVMVQSGPLAVLTDPFLSDNVGTDRYAHADLPDVIDYVLITHGHQDHLELGTLLKLRHKIGSIVVPKTSSGALQDPSLRLCLEALGFPSVIDVEPGDVLDLSNGRAEARIVVCPFIGEHCDLDIAAKVTYAVQTQRRTLYFGADNRGVDRQLFKHVHDLIGDVDQVFLGMECDGAPLSWIYGPLFLKGVDARKSRSRKLNGSNAKEAIGMVRQLQAKKAFVYAMGWEPWLLFVMATNYTDDSYQLRQVAEFLDRCSSVGIAAKELRGRAEFYP